jgi:hypothetical protein
MRRPDGSYETRDTMESIIAKQAETIRQQAIQLDRKDDYIRKLESGFERVEAGNWESPE